MSAIMLLCSNVEQRKFMDCLEGCIRCCNELAFSYKKLIAPRTYMSEKELEFFYTHGMDKMVKWNGVITISHRCQNLSLEGKCLIYETRPMICREYKCDAR